MYCKWLFELLKIIGYEIDYKSNSNKKFFDVHLLEFSNIQQTTQPRIVQNPRPDRLEEDKKEEAEGSSGDKKESTKKKKTKKKKN